MFKIYRTQVTILPPPPGASLHLNSCLKLLCIPVYLQASDHLPFTEFLRSDPWSSSSFI